MNFKQLANFDDLTQLAQNPEKLDDYINQSQGYILQLMKEFNVLPELSVLIKEPNIYALSFIENNYVLNHSEKKLITEVLEKHSIPKPIQTTSQSAQLTEEELIEYLVNETALPSQSSFDPTIPLSYEIFVQYQKEIEKQYELGSGIKKILQYAFEKYSAEEILSINKDFIWKHPELLEMNYNRMVHLKKPEFAQLYRDTMLNNFHTANMDKFRWYDFNNNEEDKKLFTYLMNNADFYSRYTYKQYTEMRGDHDYYTREEYLQIFTPHKISDWEDEYILENQDLLRNCWKKILTDAERQEERYNYDSHFLTEILGHLKPEICQQVLNQEIIELFVKHDIQIFFDWDEEDDSPEKLVIYDNIRNNRDWLEQQMFKVLNEKPELLSAQMVFQWSTHMDMIDGKDYLSASLLSCCLKNENLIDFMRYQIDYTKTPGFYNIPAHQKSSNYYPGHGLLRKNLAMIDNMIAHEPSVNLLFLLMNELAFIEKNGNEETRTNKAYHKLLKQTQQCAASLDEKEVSLLVNFFSHHPQLALPENHGIEGVKQTQSDSRVAVTDDSHNLFSYRQYQANSDMQALLYFIAPKYSDYLLSNDFTECLSDTVLIVLFKQMKMDFLKSYMLKHPEILTQNEDDTDSFINYTRKLPLERLIFQWDDEKEKKKLSSIIKEYQKILEVDDDARYKQKDKWDKHIDICQTELTKIPYRYLKEAYKELLDNHEFLLLNRLRKDNLLKIFPSTQTVAQQFLDNKSASDILELLNHSGFSQFVNDCEGCFSTSYNNEEYYQIASKMKSMFKRDQNIDIDASFIAKFFVSKDFFNRFLIHHFPQEVFEQMYDFGTVKGWSQKYPFSASEIIEAYENLKEKDHLIAIETVVKKIVDFAERYWTDSSGESIFNQVKDYAKNNDSMLFAVLNHNNVYIEVYQDSCVINNRNWSKKYINFLTNLFSESDNNQDYLPLMDGYQKILQSPSASSKRFSILPMMGSLDNSYHNDDVHSEEQSFNFYPEVKMDEKKIHQLLEILYENSPLLTLHLSQFCWVDMKEYQKTWIENNNEKFINHLFFDNEDLAITFTKNNKELGNLLDILLNQKHTENSYYHAQYLNHLLDTATLFKECNINNPQFKNSQMLTYLLNSPDLVKKVKTGYMYLKLDNQVKDDQEEDTVSKMKI